MKNFYILVILMFLTGSYSIANSVPKDTTISAEKRFAKAESYIDAGNFEEAVVMYESLLREDPNSAILNFYLGYCYLNITDKKDRAAKYLKKAVQDIPEGAESETYIKVIGKTKELSEVPLEAMYFLGKAYHANYKFQEALDVYNKLLVKLPPKSEDFEKAVKREIVYCKNGIELTKNRVEMEVIPLTNLSSDYSDHSPVLSANEETLIFTSLREGNKGKQLAEGQWAEDIYISQKIDGEWTAPKLISDNINSKGNDASISLSVDGKQLYIYKDATGKGDIYYSESENGQTWSKPEKLNDNINTKYKETHASISADGQYLYFVSDREKQKEEGKLFKQKIGYGGLDLYVSKRLPDGSWAKAKNLGSILNTNEDEEGVFVHPNGTLYFSSKSHNSMGGYDIFSSTQNEEGVWSKPVNIGYPINTTDDDLYYVVNPASNKAYYASSQQNVGALNRADLYQIGFGDGNFQNIALYEGILKLENDSPLDSAVIYVRDPESDELIGTFRPDKTTGKYYMLLSPTKDYSISYEEVGYEPAVDTLPVARTNSYLQKLSANNLGVTTLYKPSKYADYAIAINDIMFEFNKFVINEELNPGVFQSLDKFAEYLTKDPSLGLQIDGHCCKIGTEKYNVKLSAQRATFVKDYLVKKGVNAKNITIKEFGYSTPIAINQNSDGSWKEESMKFNRRIEFKVTGENAPKVKVVSLQVPDKFKVNKEL